MKIFFSKFEKKFIQKIFLYFKQNFYFALFSVFQHVSFFTHYLPFKVLFPSVDEIQLKLNKCIDVIQDIGKSFARWGELQERKFDNSDLFSFSENINDNSKSSKSNKKNLKTIKKKKF